MVRGSAYLGLALVALAIPGRTIGQQTQPSPGSLNDRGMEMHSRRCLDDASRFYARVLQLDPPKELTASQLRLVRRFAPRLYTIPGEFFALKDFAVILEPQSRTIAYHFFWADDIDFPEDNDPCDHELIWVRYSADEQSIENVWTYFHGRILPANEAALAEARQHGGRPRINVQWGKHGSLPIGWEKLEIRGNAGDTDFPANRPVTLAEYQKKTFDRLSKEGRRLPDNPLALRLGWPMKYSGTYRDFTNFSRVVEPLLLLDRNRMARVSRWNNATINQFFLPYNFRPKTEWPAEEIAERPPVVASGAGSVEFNTRVAEFKLPAKAVFDRTMPRYPNAWFYIDASLANSYKDAVKMVTEGLRTGMRLPEFYGPFSNPEGCDFETIIEHLQPWEVRTERAAQHSHAFHMRYFYSALERQGLERIKLDIGGSTREYYRFAASVHYEVEHTNPNHADVESCPICGRTGEYAGLKGNLVELVHDPLGLELLLTGKIRGEPVKFWDWEGREIGSVAWLTQKFSVFQVMFPAQADDKNTLRIGVVVLTAK